MRLWFRSQFSPEVGLGHLMRALAVAEVAVEKGLEVVFVPKDAPGDLVGLPSRHGFPTWEPDDGDWLETVQPGDGVLFDGYDFTTADHRAAGARGARVAAVDDFGAGRFDVDVLVNPNVLPDPRYDTPSGAEVLIGPTFAMVRSQFRSRRRLRSGTASRLVVVLGGSDTTGLRPLVIDLLRTERPFRRVVMLTGPAAPPVPKRPEDDGWLDVVHDPTDVAKVFDEADAALAAAGTVTWELLTMGIPTGLVQVADNQRHVLAIAGEGCALSLGRRETMARRLPAVLDQLADPVTQRRLSAAACATIDGLGAARVLAALTRRAGDPSSSLNAGR